MFDMTDVAVTQTRALPSGLGTYHIKFTSLQTGMMLTYTCCWQMQVQHENLQQAEVLNNHAQQLEAMQTNIQDTQKLLSALQSKAAFHRACSSYWKCANSHQHCPSCLKTCFMPVGSAWHTPNFLLI